MTPIFRNALAGLLLMLGAVSSPAVADQAVVAVATNFREAMDKLAEEFEAETPHRLHITSASTGILYAQIRNGAPFDVLLAADQERPRTLEAEGAAVPGSRFTYAVGRLMLWSADPSLIAVEGRRTLAEARFTKLALANPDLAPYGAAAMETLESLGLADQLNSRVVMGTNIGQVHAMVATGSAPLGFVASSHVLSKRNATQGSRWDVPLELHSPILQDAVLLSRAIDNPAAQAFLRFLKGKSATSTIRAHGYDVEKEGSP
jgi:molybdate transport system substrate-binding protein